MPERDAPAADLIAERRAKLQRLRDEFHVDPYGHRVDGLVTLAEARARYDEAADAAHREDATRDDRPRVRVAGRVVQARVMGNLIFMSLRDATGDLQVAVSKKAVGPETFKLAKLTDLSDIVVVSGALGTTKTGEKTVWAEGTGGQATSGTPESDAEATGEAHGLEAVGFQMAAKSLAPPPGKWHGLQDAELRYRKRYVDLYANPRVMRTMQRRVEIIDAIRDYMRARGYLEVETPMLQPVHGGAAARPFETHHNALDMRLYLRIAPELYLKRLLVGGMPKVFEINRNFRNEGVSPRHNPEFTMLEAYEAFGSWETMAELVEDMICTVAEKMCGSLVIEDGKPCEPSADQNEYGFAAENEGLGPGIDLSGDTTKPRGQRWRRVSMVELVEERTKRELGTPLVFDKRDVRESSPAFWKGLQDELQYENRDHITQVWRRGRARRLLERLPELTPAEQLMDVYEKLIEPTLIDPTFVTRVPGDIIPLAKRCPDDPYFADVYELAINGVEISPGYTELNDPDVQAAHFAHQLGDREEQQQHDEDFLEALRVGMPPAGGIGLGIDRLVMMLTGAESIRDVILFPLMRPREASR
ncbi:MAG: amino acid--tRNA ligase-related protein [Phycisphaeraceae bacterium]